MKFLFCGDQSVPEWFLSQLNLLANLSFVKLRKVGGLYVVHVTDPEQSESSLQQIIEILQASDFGEAEAKTIVAMLDFIISNSARNNVDQEQLMKELIDLGIPKENCQSLCKIMEQNQEKIRIYFRKQVLRQNKFEEIAIKRFNVLRNSSNSNQTGEYMELSLQTIANNLKGQPNKLTFCMDKAQFSKFTEDMGSIMKILSGQTE